MDKNLSLLPNLEYPVSFPRGKSGHSVMLNTHFYWVLRLKWVELYFYSPSTPIVCLSGVEKVKFSLTSL